MRRREDGSTEATDRTLLDGVLYTSENLREGRETFRVLQHGSLSVWSRRNPGEKMPAALQMTRKDSAVSRTEGSTEATDAGVSAASEDAEGWPNVGSRTNVTQDMTTGQRGADAIAAG